MYTDDMRMAFRSLDHYRPKKFTVQVEDNENFLVIRASEPSFMPLLDEEKRQAIEYMIRLKDAFEQNGAIVLIVREGGKEL
jgi:hypothetical protein